MPKILSEKYEPPLLSLNDYRVKGFTVKDNGSFYLEHVDVTIQYNLLIKNTDGCLALELNNECVGHIQFTPLNTFVNGLDNCIAINSSFVIEEQRGQSIAPHSYKALTEHFNVVSDSEQTPDGASIWRTKLTQFDDVDIHIIKNDGQFMVDENGELVIYKYNPLGNNPYDSQIWGFEKPSLQKDNSVINASEDENREDVRLIAVKKQT